MRKFTLASHEAKANCINTITEIPADGKYTVLIEKTQSKRSVAQNNLYHLWLNIIGNELGYTHREIDELMKAEFLPSKVVTLGNEEVIVRPSTTALTRRNFSKYLSMIDIWAAEQGIILPKGEDWAVANGEAA